MDNSLVLDSFRLTSLLRTWVGGIAIATVLVSCKKTEPTREQTKSAPARRVVGVYPEDFQCTNLLTPEQAQSLQGGTVRYVDSNMPVPTGVPKPCAWVVDIGGATQAWTFDIDCRDEAKRTADKLFDQYLSSSASAHKEYAGLMDAGYKTPPDAPPSRAPQPATEVAVGARGLDHAGQAVLFWDDDAPCYVRVVGPAQDQRLSLALHLAKALTPATAPMTPRPAE